MDIRCERCATEYEIEDERVPDNGLTLKCATCGHVFKVLKSRGAVSAPPIGPPAVVGSSAPPPVVSAAFALRLYRGGAPIPATCPDMGTLHQWIIEQRLVANDEVSFAGEPWRVLSVVPELVPFFALLSVAPPPKVRPGTPPPAPAVVQPPPPPPPTPIPAVTAPQAAWAPEQSITPALTPMHPQILVPPPAPPPLLAPAMVAAPAPDPRASFRSALTATTPPPGKSPFGKARTDDELTPVYGSPNMPTPLGTPLWNAHIQTLPPSSHAPKAGGTFPPSMEIPTGGHDESTASTQQIRMTPEMFAAAEAARPGAVTANTPAPSWPPVGSVPIASKSPPAPTIAMHPISAVGDTTPDVSLARGAKQPNGSAGQTTPIRPMPAITQAPSSKSGKKTPASTAAVKRAPDHDPEISAFLQRGKLLRVLMLAAVVLVVVAVIVYFAFPSLFGDAGPTPEAKVALDKGRELYLGDTLSTFPDAEKEIKKAVGREKGGYPDAEGALAELETGWAELLLDQYTSSSAELTAKAEGGDNANAKVLLPKVKKLADDAKKKLAAALDSFNASKETQTTTPASERAALDYYRLANDPPQAAAVAEALKAETDPETQAHVAAWQALDPKSVDAAEATLKDVVQKLPGFVRARWWLAQLHIRAKNTKAALDDMKGILTVAPNQESAKDYVAAAAKTAAAAPPEPPAQDLSPDKLPTEPQKAEKPKEEKPKETEKPKEAESKTLPRLPADEVSRRTGGDTSSKIVDTDKAMDQASHSLEKGKPAKALELYDKVLSVKPTLSDALYGKGLALYEMGHTEDAIIAFKKTLEVNHRFGDAMMGIAEAYRRIHDNKSAIKFYQQYLDMYPTGAQAAQARKIVQDLNK